jgi:hypothetical protein
MQARAPTAKANDLGKPPEESNCDAQVNDQHASISGVLLHDTADAPGLRRLTICLHFARFAEAHQQQSKLYNTKALAS